MRTGYFLQRGLMTVAILIGSTILARTAAAAQEFHLCELFDIDDAARLVRQPIVNTVEAAEGSRFVCARYAVHAATLLEVTRYANAGDAAAQLSGGTALAGLGDANSLTTTPDGTIVILRVTKGPYLVAIEVNLDNPPNGVTADDLARRVQAVLDNLAALPVASPLVPTGDSGCGPASAAAISYRLRSPDVTSVRIIGGCHNISIATSLDDSGSSAVGRALVICDKVAAFAYTGPRSAISVSSKGGRELAIGIKDQLCIGEL